MALYFMTPIMYNSNILPKTVQKILIIFNPMTGYVILYRDVMYYGVEPRYRLLLYSLGLSVFILFLGCFVFQNLQKKFAEIL